MIIYSKLSHLYVDPSMSKIYLPNYFQNLYYLNEYCYLKSNIFIYIQLRQWNNR